MSGFVLLKFASHLVLPPASMTLGFLFGVLLALAGMRRLGVAAALLSALETLILSMAPISEALVSPLEESARYEASRAWPCCYSAIVVLGGDWNHNRLLYGAELYNSGAAARIIVSGGDLAADPGASAPEGEQMKRLLIQIGIPSNAIITEDVSRNTAESIANVKQIVGDDAIALVTSAYHMKRALKLARQAGLKAYAFPTDFAPNAGQLSLWGRWLPTVEALQLSAASLWEYLGITFDYRTIRSTGA